MTRPSSAEAAHTHTESRAGETVTRVLISNDDGFRAPGIRALAENLSRDYVIDVVAPDRNRSGASNSLSLHAPLRAQQHEDGVWSVEGTPTDCVHLALTCLLTERPALVVSGINNGPNLGDDVLYSGTVAAAMEGRFLGAPAIAFSCAQFEPRHWDTAARVARRIVAQVLKRPLPADTILNVNIPDLPWEALKGVQVTRLGKRHLAEGTVRDQDPRGRPIYWISCAGEEADCGPGTDFHALSEGCVSISPVLVDLTRYDALSETAAWAEGLL